MALRAGLSRTAISDYVNGKRVNYDSDALVSIARALSLAPDVVFRAAGIFPPKPGDDVLVEEGLRILQQLDGEDREDAIRYLRMRQQVADQRGKANARDKKRPARSG